jgi:hypothetical protein
MWGFGQEVLTVIAPKRGALVSLLSSGEPRISFCNEDGVV